MVLLSFACSTTPVSAPSPEPLPEDVAEVVAGDVLPPVYPVLKAYDWPHKAASLHEPFAGSDKPPVPVIAYGYNAEDHYVFLTEQDGRSLADVKAEAQKNIEAWSGTWEPINPTVLTASGTDFSAEKILDTAFLVQAQEKLGAKRILVGVPRRRVLYAANADAPQADMDQFVQVFNYTWNDDSFGNAPITNLLFEYTDGKMTGARIVE